MTFREEATDNQFLAHGQRRLGADDAEFLDAAGTAPFEGFQGDEVADIDTGALGDQGGEFRAIVLI